MTHLRLIPLTRLHSVAFGSRKIEKNEINIQDKESFAYRDERIIDPVKRGHANIMIFSDGEYWEREGIGFVYALGGLWGDQEGDVHLIASEDIFIDADISPF